MIFWGVGAGWMCQYVVLDSCSSFVTQTCLIKGKTFVNKTYWGTGNCLAHQGAIDRYSGRSILCSPTIHQNVDVLNKWPSCVDGYKFIMFTS